MTTVQKTIIYKYLIINLEDGEVSGTDDDSIADRASEQEALIVIHRELCVNIMSGTRLAIKQENPDNWEND